jgi:hypothetical protein
MARVPVANTTPTQNVYLSALPAQVVGDAKQQACGKVAACVSVKYVEPFFAAIEEARCAQGRRVYIPEAFAQHSTG